MLSEKLENGRKVDEARMLKNARKGTGSNLRRKKIKRKNRTEERDS